MTKSRRIAVLVMLVLGTTLLSADAKASDIPVFEGYFTLTSETRWGMATLPAGDYSFTLDHEYVVGTVTVRRGTAVVARIHCISLTNMKFGQSAMIAENGAVRRLNLPQLGVSFSYPMRNSHQEGSPQGHAVPEMIPVSAGMGR